MTSSPSPTSSLESPSSPPQPSQPASNAAPPSPGSAGGEQSKPQGTQGTPEPSPQGQQGESSSSSSPDSPSADADYTSYLESDDLGDALGDVKRHDKLPPLHELLPHTMPEVRDHVSRMRAAYMREKQALAAEKKALQEQRDSYLAERDAFLKGEFAEKVRTLAGKEVDPNTLFTPEGQEALARQKGAQMMQEFMAPLQRELETQKRRSAMQAFASEHPDLLKDDKVFAGVKEVMQANPGVSLAVAYNAVKGRLLQSEAAVLRERDREDRERRRRAASGVLEPSTVKGSEVPARPMTWAEAREAAKRKHSS